MVAIGTQVAEGEIAAKAHFETPTRFSNSSGRRRHERERRTVIIRIHKEV